MAEQLTNIQTPRLSLRGIDESDAEKIVEWRAAPDVYRYFKSPHQVTLQEHLTWYRTRYLADPSRFDWMAIENNTGKRIGVFGLVHTGDEAEVNYLLSPTAQGKGYAAEAVSALISYATATWHVTHMTAEIHKDNAASIRLAERLGFQLSAVDGVFLIYKIEGTL